MARIAGVEVAQQNNVQFGLTKVYGIGRTTAAKILGEANVAMTKRVGDLTDQEVSRINNIIDKNYKVEGELKQVVFNNIKRLKDVRAYRGLRHKFGLPTRGQNTRSNAVTRKGKSAAVGGLNRKIDKK
jgi:small subunit ribosomal protein S13